MWESKPRFEINYTARGDFLCATNRGRGGKEGQLTWWERQNSFLLGFLWRKDAGRGPLTVALTGDSASSKDSISFNHGAALTLISSGSLRPLPLYLFRRSSSLFLPTFINYITMESLLKRVAKAPLFQSMNTRNDLKEIKENIFGVRIWIHRLI